jgi:hypothetical protein
MRQMMEGSGPKIFSPFPITPEYLESWRNLPRVKWDPPPKPPRQRPFLVEGENGKKITLDNAGEFFKFTVDLDVVTVAIAALGLRFQQFFSRRSMQRARFMNASMPRRGPAISTRFGSSPVPIWLGWRWTKLVSASVFRTARSSARSTYWRQPDLEPMPKAPQHYPANLVD